MNFDRKKSDRYADSELAVSSNQQFLIFMMFVRKNFETEIPI